MIFGTIDFEFRWTRRILASLVFGISASALPASGQEPAVSGYVHDSIRARPYANQTILIAASARPVVTDGSGRFEILGLEPGEHTLLIPHPALDALGLPPVRYRLHVPEEGIRARLHVPSLETLALDACPSSDEDPRGAIVGRVEREDAGPVHGGRVTAEWEEGGRTRSVSAEPGSDGVYLLCGIPERTVVRVRTFTRDGAGTPAIRRLSDRSLAVRADLLAPASRSAPLEVRVVDVESGVPLLGAAVEVEGEGRRGTDSAGRARWGAVEAGRHIVRIRHLGYGSTAHEVEVAAGDQPHRVEFALAPVPVELEGLDVTARRYPLGSVMERFNARMEIGRGSFITREVLAELESLPLSQVIDREVTGIRNTCNTSAGSSRCALRSQRALPSLAGRRCEVVYFIDGMQIEPLHPNEPVFVDELLRPWDVEALEVYTGPSQTPAEFNRFDARCGVIVIWTRQPGSSSEPNGG